MVVRSKIFRQEIRRVIPSSFQRRKDFPRIVLTERQLCDLELILSGGFFPFDSGVYAGLGRVDGNAEL